MHCHRNAILVQLSGGQDAEIHTGYGRIERVGCANLSAYDLTVHSVPAKEKLAERRVVEQWQLDINKKTSDPKFKEDAGAVEEVLLGYTDECYAKLQKELETNGAIKL